MLSDSTLNPLTKPRIEFIDLVRCFAFFCVLWHHSLSNLNDANLAATSDHYFVLDPFYKFFLTFHMPIFFMISGFFFVSSLNLSFKEVLRKRFTTLIIPYIVWVIILAFANWGMTLLGWKMAADRPFSVLGQLEAFLVPDPKVDFWFFRELFVTDIIVFIFCKIFKKLPIAFIGSMLFVMLFDWFGIVTKTQRFMLPIFWTGILLKAYYPFFTKHLNKFLISFGILFAACYYFYQWDYAIYFSQYPAIINLQQSFVEGKIVFDFTSIGVSGWRFLAGVTGSLFFFALFQRFWKKNAVTSSLSHCGQLTVGMYGLQAILLQRTMGNLLDFSGINIWVYRLIITPCSAVFTLFVCVLMIRLIQNNKPLTFMLCGSSVVVDRSNRQDSVQVVDVQGAA
ncbi:MAG: acyltransferase [Treponema sp.]|jgi:fucose 4-O-acetylase-like acetyltransferase|nr:acyltransferase [Treponema sp.]